MKKIDSIALRFSFGYALFWSIRVYVLFILFFFLQLFLSPVQVAWIDIRHFSYALYFLVFMFVFVTRYRVIRRDNRIEDDIWKIYEVYTKPKIGKRDKEYDTKRIKWVIEDKVSDLDIRIEKSNKLFDSLIRFLPAPYIMFWISYLADNNFDITIIDRSKLNGVNIAFITMMTLLLVMALFLFTIFNYVFQLKHERSRYKKELRKIVESAVSDFT